MHPEQRQQRTLANRVDFTGIGLHTGQIVHLNFVPAEPNSGITFRRTDLPDQPEIPANIDYVTETQRNTTLGLGDTRIYTVEHVLAALAANGIDNLVVELDGIEPPIANGSSDAFVEMIEKAGVKEQKPTIKTITLNQPVYFSQGDIHIVALPCESYKISYTLSYPKSKILDAQYFSTVIDPVTFNQEIAPCRSFGLMEEVGPLLDRGLIKGCSLSNSVVIDDDIVFSKDGLFFPDEMARHKVLDVVGDLSLIGIPFTAHIIAIRSGHATHKLFASKLRESLLMEKSS